MVLFVLLVIGVVRCGIIGDYVMMAPFYYDWDSMCVKKLVDEEHFIWELPNCRWAVVVCVVGSIHHSGAAIWQSDLACVKMVGLQPCLWLSRVFFGFQEAWDEGLWGIPVRNPWSVLGQPKTFLVSVASFPQIAIHQSFHKLLCLKVV